MQHYNREQMCRANGICQIINVILLILTMWCWHQCCVYQEMHSDQSAMISCKSMQYAGVCTNKSTDESDTCTWNCAIMI